MQGQPQAPTRPIIRLNHRRPGGYAGIRLFTLARIPVYARLSLFAILVMLAVIFGGSLFPEQYKSAHYSNAGYALMGIAASVLFFLSVLVHEVAHCLMARTAIGGHIPIRRITLFFLGGLSEMTEEPKTAAGELVISFSGPLTSIVLGGIMWPAGWLLSTAGTPVFITGVLSYIGYLNIFLGVTNLLPGFPLDGGRVLRAIIWSASGNFLGATKISAAVGRALGIGIALVGAVFIVAPSGGMANFLNGIFLVMVGLFIERSARESLTFALLKAGMEGLTVAEAMYTGLPNVWDEVTLAEAAEHLMRWRVEALPVVNGQGHLRGVLTAGMLNEISRYDWGRARVKDLFEDETAPAFTRPQEPLPAVFILMLRYALVALPVLDAEARIIGMITLRDLYRLAGHRSGMRT